MTIQANFPAIKPSLLLDFQNTKQLDSRITYTRASTASYYDGVTTSKAEQNLATYSQQFDNAAWLKENSSITADSTTAPDGTTTADSLVESSATGPHGTYTALLSVTTASTVTVSIYAKQNTKRYIVLGSTDGFANYPVLFDLQSGVVVGNATGYPAYSAPTSSTITSVGSSWYRLTVTVTINGAASSARIIAYLTDDSGSVSTGFSYTGNGTSSAYIWGAQLEQRSAVSAYTATTTQAITNYIPKLQSAASGVARFDNNPTTGESLGLLIEESRANLATYSAQFDNAAWGKSNITLTANTLVSPDGTISADTFTRGSVNSAESNARQTTTQAVSTAHTLSVYAKVGTTGAYLYLRNLAINDSIPNGLVVFNPANGTVVSTGSAYTSTSITSVGNGWYRFAVTGTTPASIANNFIDVGVCNASGTVGGLAGDTIFVWGAQLEVGAFATSYIPTVASQVTRAADAASMTGTNFSSWFNNGEGSMYLEHNIPSSGGGLNFLGWALNTGTASTNAINLFANYSSTGRVRVFGYNGTTIDMDTYSGTVLTANTFNKTSMAIKANDFALSVNGATVVTDTAAAVPPVNQLAIGSYGGGTSPLNGWIKKIAFYPIRVTNAQLQALTS